MAAEQAFAALTRHGRPVTLAILDLDCLKDYNHEHGHQAGPAAALGGRPARRERARSADATLYERKLMRPKHGEGNGRRLQSERVEAAPPRA